MLEYTGDDDAHSCPYFYLWDMQGLGKLSAYTTMALVTVSYTHLDVYKRQDSGSPEESESANSLSGDAETGSGEDFVPVSYTHLDVYKRQAL